MLQQKAEEGLLPRQAQTMLTLVHPDAGKLLVPIVQPVQKEPVHPVPPVRPLPGERQIMSQQPDRELVRHLPGLPPVTEGIIPQHIPDLHLKGRSIPDLQTVMSEQLSQEAPAPISQVQELSLPIQDRQAVLPLGPIRAVQVRVLPQDLHTRGQAVHQPAPDRVQEAQIPIAVQAVRVPTGAIQVRADQVQEAAIRDPATQDQAEAIPHRPAQVRAEVILHHPAQDQAEVLPEEVQVPVVPTPVRVQVQVVQGQAPAAVDDKQKMIMQRIE